MNTCRQSWSKPERLVLVPLAGLALVLMARQGLGIQADPLKVIAALLAAGAALAIATRHPAAFIAPVLFLPRLREVGALSEFGPAAHWTALELACALLGMGFLLRWLLRPARPMAVTLPPGTELRDANEWARPRSASGPFLAFFAFDLVVTVSYAYTASPHYGEEKLVAFLALGCTLFFAPSLFVVDPDDFRDFVVGTVLFGMLVAASSFSFSATGAMGAEDNPAHIGKGQVIGLAILLLIYTPLRKRWLKLFVLAVCIPTLAIGLVSAETRGPLFSLIFVLLLSFVLDSFRSPVFTRKQMGMVGGALVGAVLLLSAFWFYGAEASRFRYKTAEIVNLFEDNGEAKGTAVERLVFYRAAIDLWSERPVAGWGVGGWSMAYWHNDLREYPHNLFLETLLEEGVVGLTALLAFLVLMFRHLRACQPTVQRRLPWLLPGLVYLVSIAMFSGDLDDDRFIWFWCGFALAGCCLAARSFSQSGQNPRGETSGEFAPFATETRLSEGEVPA